MGKTACDFPKFLFGAVMALAMGIFTCPVTANAQIDQSLRNLSIEDLGQISVTSVSKTEEPLADAPAAIFVITHDDIHRSGAATLPEMLRLAPNLQVYQEAPGQWVVTARGMDGNPGAQSYSNKLLVLVDGRSVYSPLYSGVYWDLPDVLPGDIDRIEVISGPGATLWGANAVNGVINIITRSAATTQGLQVDLRGGSSRQALGLRYGGRLGEDVALRASVRWLHEDPGLSASGASESDPFQRLGANAQIEWTPSSRDTVTAIGEISDGRLGESELAHQETATRNLSLRWQRSDANGNALQVQAYYDRVERYTEPTYSGFYTDTWNLDIQDTLSIGTRNHVVWGGGVRLTHYGIAGTGSLTFDPSVGNLNLADAFIQDKFDITRRLTLTAGLKLEKDPFATASLLPEVRISWKPSTGALLWAAMSGAVRSPTPFDRDVDEQAGYVTLTGDKSFRTEKLTAYEGGLRIEPARSVSISATGYYNDYNSLRSIELLPEPGLNLTWGNNLFGHSYGFDGWFNWRLFKWWTLSGGMSLLHEHFAFTPAGSGLLGPSQLGSDPSHQFQLRSSIDMPAEFQLDATWRAVGSLPAPYVPSYREIDLRLARPIFRKVNVQITGTNLLHAQHLEYLGGDYIPRRIMAGLELSL